MDFNIVTLEVADLLTHFDYYNQLVTDIGKAEDQDKINRKHQEHLSEFFPDTKLYDGKKELLPLNKLKSRIIIQLKDMKNKEIHELVEQLEKDTKKMKKLYKALSKK